MRKRWRVGRPALPFVCRKDQALPLLVFSPELTFLYLGGWEGWPPPRHLPARGDSLRSFYSPSYPVGLS